MRIESNNAKITVSKPASPAAGKVSRRVKEKSCQYLIITCKSENKREKYSPKPELEDSCQKKFNAGINIALQIRQKPVKITNLRLVFFISRARSSRYITLSSSPAGGSNNSGELKIL